MFARLKRVGYLTVSSTHGLLINGLPVSVLATSFGSLLQPALEETHLQERLSAAGRRLAWRELDVARHLGEFIPKN
jgi:hypothetical protein